MTPATTTQPDWEAIRSVVFDIDGTLYDQRPLRRRMLRELGRHGLSHPIQTPSLLRIIHAFRSERERLAEANEPGISDLQFERPAARLGIPRARVEAIAKEWIEERPLPFLRGCRFSGVLPLFSKLQAVEIRIGVLSDYPATPKLEALGLEANAVLSAVDPEVDRLKPHPKGLEILLERLDTAPEHALFIGDRDDRDGVCARRVGVPFLLKTSAESTGPGSFSDYRKLLASLAEL